MLNPSELARLSTSFTFSKNGEALGSAELLVAEGMVLFLPESTVCVSEASTPRCDIAWASTSYLTSQMWRKRRYDLGEAEI